MTCQHDTEKPERCNGKFLQAQEKPALPVTHYEARVAANSCVLRHKLGSP